MGQAGASTWPGVTLAAFGALVAGSGVAAGSAVPAVAGAVAACTGLVWMHVRRRKRPADASPVEQGHPATQRTPPESRVPPGLEPAVVLGAVREAVSVAAPAVAAHLWLVDDPSATMRQVAATGPMMPSSQPVPLDGDDVLARACRSGSAEAGPLARIRGDGDAATIWRYALPVAAGDAPGVMAVDIRCDGEPDLAALPVLIGPLRGSIAGALGLHVARLELETARQLVDAARDLSRMLDPDQVLAVALQRAMMLSGAQTGSIMLLNADGRLRIAHAEGLPAGVVESTDLGENEGIAGWVLSTGQPLLIEDLPGRTSTARRHGVRSAVSVPLADDDGMLGVLNVGSRTFPARFTESHLRSIEVLGRQTATALRNARAIEQSRVLYFDTLKALAIAMETKDPYSTGGTERVLELTDAIGSVFSLSDEEGEALRIAALLHDIGMSAAGEGVASTDRPLSTVERALLKMHPQIAAEMLSEAPALQQVAPIVYHHHEWYDGHGYANGISGESIPLGARILAVADAYVAMTSPRPYRQAYGEREALEELTTKAGTQFDPAVVDALCDILRSGTNRVPGSSGGGF